MKKILFLTCFTLYLFAFGQTGIYAQPPQGGRPGGGTRPMIGPPRDTMNYGEPEKLMLEHFPDIPGLSLEQRADIGVIMVKEQKEIGKQIKKKRQLLEEQKETSSDEKAQKKIQKNIEEADKKIKQRIEKSDKKIKKILSEEQYRIFMEKRAEFQFRNLPTIPHHNGNYGERPDRPKGGRQGGRRP
jgi:hypothetical protein